MLILAVERSYSQEFVLLKRSIRCDKINRHKVYVPVSCRDSGPRFRDIKALIALIINEHKLRLFFT